MSREIASNALTAVQKCTQYPKEYSSFLGELLKDHPDKAIARVGSSLSGWMDVALDPIIPNSSEIDPLDTIQAITNEIQHSETSRIPNFSERDVDLATNISVGGIQIVLKRLHEEEIQFVCHKITADKHLLKFKLPLEKSNTLEVDLLCMPDCPLTASTLQSERPSLQLFEITTLNAGKVCQTMSVLQDSDKTAIDAIFGFLTNSYMPTPDFVKVITKNPQALFDVLKSFIKEKAIPPQVTALLESETVKTTIREYATPRHPSFYVELLKVFKYNPIQGTYQLVKAWQAMVASGLAAILFPGYQPREARIITALTQLAKSISIEDEFFNISKVFICIIAAVHGQYHLDNHDTYEQLLTTLLGKNNAVAKLNILKRERAAFVKDMEQFDREQAYIAGRQEAINLIGKNPQQLVFIASEDETSYSIGYADGYNSIVNAQAMHKQSYLKGWEIGHNIALRNGQIKIKPARSEQNYMFNLGLLAGHAQQYHAGRISKDSGCYSTSPQHPMSPQSPALFTEAGTTEDKGLPKPQPKTS